MATLRREDFWADPNVEFVNEIAFRAHVYEMALHEKERLALGRVEGQHRLPSGKTILCTIYGDGVIRAGTRPTGSFLLSDERNVEVDEDFRSNNCWYDQDGQAIMAFTFPTLFTTYERKMADKVIRDYWPEAWERVNRRVLDVSESREKARREFRREHATDFVTVWAIDSYFFEDMVEVIALPGGDLMRDGEERSFLVPKGEYQTRTRWGFVIDEGRHQAYHGPSSFKIVKDLHR